MHMYTNAMIYIQEAQDHLISSGFDCKEADKILELLWKDCYKLDDITVNVIRPILHRNGKGTQEALDQLAIISTITKINTADYLVNSLTKALEGCGFY